MTAADQKELDAFVVSPIGKYGKSYVLNKRSYKFYLAWKIIFYSSLMFLLLTKFIHPVICTDELDWFCAASPPTILIFTLLGIFAQSKFASYGRLATPEQAAELLNRKLATYEAFAYKVYWLIASTVSIALSVILLISMHTRFELGKPIPFWGYLLLVACLFVPFHCYRKWRAIT